MAQDYDLSPQLLCITALSTPRSREILCLRLLHHALRFCFTATFMAFPLMETVALSFLCF